MAINPGRRRGGGAEAVLTETCPLRQPGLRGDVTEMDGPAFWDSKELEPEEQRSVNPPVLSQSQ